MVLRCNLPDKRLVILNREQPGSHPEARKSKIETSLSQPADRKLRPKPRATRELFGGLVVASQRVQSCVRFAAVAAASAETLAARPRDVLRFLGTHFVPGRAGQFLCAQYRPLRELRDGRGEKNSSTRGGLFG